MRARLGSVGSASVVIFLTSLLSIDKITEFVKLSGIGVSAPPAMDENQGYPHAPHRRRKINRVRSRSGNATIVGAARSGRQDRAEIRLRHRRLRRLHGACRRRGGALLQPAGGP